MSNWYVGMFNWEIVSGQRLIMSYLHASMLNEHGTMSKVMTREYKPELKLY